MFPGMKEHLALETGTRAISKIQRLKRIKVSKSVMSFILMETFQNERR